MTKNALAGFNQSAGLSTYPRKISARTTRATALGGGSGSRSGSGICIVILVVETTKVVGYNIRTIADYLAMLTLSVAQSPDHCDSLPSILDIMSSSCGTCETLTAITACDLAFLKALYFENTGLGARFPLLGTTCGALLEASEGRQGSVNVEISMDLLRKRLPKSPLSTPELMERCAYLRDRRVREY